MSELHYSRDVIKGRAHPWLLHHGLQAALQKSPPPGSKSWTASTYRDSDANATACHDAEINLPRCARIDCPPSTSAICTSYDTHCNLGHESGSTPPPCSVVHTASGVASHRCSDSGVLSRTASSLAVLAAAPFGITASDGSMAAPSRGHSISGVRMETTAPRMLGLLQGCLETMQRPAPGSDPAGGHTGLALCSSSGSPVASCGTGAPQLYAGRTTFAGADGTGAAHSSSSCGTAAATAAPGFGWAGECTAGKKLDNVPQPGVPVLHVLSLEMSPSLSSPTTRCPTPDNWGCWPAAGRMSSRSVSPALASDQAEAAPAPVPAPAPAVVSSAGAALPGTKVCPLLPLVQQQPHDPPSSQAHGDLLQDNDTAASPCRTRSRETRLGVVACQGGAQGGAASSTPVPEGSGACEDGPTGAIPNALASSIHIEATPSSSLVHDTQTFARNVPSNALGHLPPGWQTSAAQVVAGSARISPQHCLPLAAPEAPRRCSPQPTLPSGRPAGPVALPGASLVQASGWIRAAPSLAAPELGSCLVSLVSAPGAVRGRFASGPSDPLMPPDLRPAASSLLRPVASPTTSGSSAAAVPLTRRARGGAFASPARACGSRAASPDAVHEHACASDGVGLTLTELAAAVSYLASVAMAGCPVKEEVRALVQIALQPQSASTSWEAPAVRGRRDLTAFQAVRRVADLAVSAANADATAKAADSRTAAASAIASSGVAAGGSRSSSRRAAAAAAAAASKSAVPAGLDLLAVVAELASAVMQLPQGNGGRRADTGHTTRPRSQRAHADHRGTSSASSGRHDLHLMPLSVARAIRRPSSAPPTPSQRARPALRKVGSHTNLTAAARGGHAVRGLSRFVADSTATAAFAAPTAPARQLQRQPGSSRARASIAKHYDMHGDVQSPQGMASTLHLPSMPFTNSDVERDIAAHAPSAAAFAVLNLRQAAAGGAKRARSTTALASGQVGPVGKRPRVGGDKTWPALPMLPGHAEVHLGQRQAGDMQAVPVAYTLRAGLDASSVSLGGRLGLSVKQEAQPPTAPLIAAGTSWGPQGTQLEAINVQRPSGKSTTGPAGSQWQGSATGLTFGGGA